MSKTVVSKLKSQPHILAHLVFAETHTQTQKTKRAKISPPNHLNIEHFNYICQTLTSLNIQVK